jgi:hypothetical protein
VYYKPVVIKAEGSLEKNFECPLKMGIFIVRMFFEKVCTTNVNLAGFQPYSKSLTTQRLGHQT